MSRETILQKGSSNKGIFRQMKTENLSLLKEILKRVLQAEEKGNQKEKNYLEGK